jgi:putative ABC transport system permease protein
MMFWRLAIKNTLRNPFRTAITLAALAFGGGALIVSGGLMADAMGQLRQSLIEGSLGHLQISRKGYFEKGSSRPFDFMIENPAEVAAVAAGRPGVRCATPRVRFFGLLSTGETTVSFAGEGVDPANERLVSSAVAVEKGEALSPGDFYHAVAGKGLARSVDADVGAPLVVVANSKEGAINALDIAVKGTFATGSKDLDDFALRMPLAAAQKLLHVSGAHSVVVLLEDDGKTSAVKSALESEFAKRGWPLEVRTWYELADFYRQAEGFLTREFVVLLVIIAMVVVLGVYNTLNMAALERVGEIGTMMALGYKRRDVARVFLAEGVVLGALGALLGLASGYAAALVISWIGIPLPPPPGRSSEMVSRVALVPALFAMSAVLSAAAALISSVQPALRASRLEIADALRQNI